MNKQPNYLFLFPDQWRWDFLGCDESGVPVRTPNVDKLAERGVRFRQCRTNSPLCAPARAALAQGVRYDRCQVPNNGYDTPADAETFFQHLRAAGYRVATCGKNDLHKATFWKGLDGWTQLLGQYGFTEAIDHSGKMDCANWGQLSKGGPHCSYASYLHRKGLFDAYHDDYERRYREMTAPTADWPSPLEAIDYTDEVCGRAGATLLERFPLEGPWMLWVNFPGPHDPFDPPETWQRWYDGVDFPEPVQHNPTYGGKPYDIQQVRRNYAACCEGIDRWLGRYLDLIEQRGELDNTVVIFASDHGEMLGDYQRFNKAVPHEGSVHVPLVMAGPGVERRGTSDALVELIDLSATMLDMAGLAVPEHFEAKSLLPQLRSGVDDTAHRDVQMMGLSQWRAVFDGQYKLVRTRDKEGQVTEAMYDIGEDWTREAPEDDCIAEHPEKAASLSRVMDDARAGGFAT